MVPSVANESPFYDRVEIIAHVFWVPGVDNRLNFLSSPAPISIEGYQPREIPNTEILQVMLLTF